MQYKSLLAGCLMAVTVSACAVNLNINDTQLVGSATSDEQRILDVISTQQAAWNAGDIDAFMQGYWQSPDLRFASGGEVAYGWQVTRDRYHSRYSNRALMGTLTFDRLETDLLADDAAIVHGAWALQRESDRPSGLFTLIFKRIDGEWKIVSDTTTSAGS
jgi:ketosteroid isomerase-like protein